VILEDNESDTPDPEAATVSAFGPSKPTDPSGHRLWYDVEDQRFIDKDLCPFPPLEQEGLASTPTPAKDQPHSCHHSPGLSQGQVGQHGRGRTMPSASEEPTPHTLPALLSKNSEGESEEENQYLAIISLDIRLRVANHNRYQSWILCHGFECPREHLVDAR
jgi:hypothetical protein